MSRLVASGLVRFCVRRLLSSGSTRAVSSLTIREQEDGIRRIILNNPKKRNALSLAMLNSLREDILTDLDNNNLRVIIISGIPFLSKFKMDFLKTGTLSLGFIN
uniref:Enoyl CoA hydratase domain containing 3 n=1 Tax=Astyanax mexicanus TaxID=7994 RepID=A0A3B1J0P8_ASTMX